MWQHEAKRTAKLEKYSLKQAIRKITGCASASFLHDVILHQPYLDGSLQKFGWNDLYWIKMCITLRSRFIALSFASYTSLLCIFIYFKIWVSANMQKYNTHQCASTEMHSLYTESTCDLTTQNLLNTRCCMF